MSDEDTPEHRHQKASSTFGRGLTLLKLDRREEGQAAIAEALKVDSRVAPEFESYGVKP